MGIKWTNQAIHFIHCTVKELNIGVLLNISFAKIAYKLISLLQKIKTALILKIGTERRLTTWKAFCMVFVSWHLVFRMNKSPMIGLQFFICQKIILSANGAVAWTMDICFSDFTVSLYHSVVCVFHHIDINVYSSLWFSLNFTCSSISERWYDKRKKSAGKFRNPGCIFSHA